MLLNLINVWRRSPVIKRILLMFLYFILEELSEEFSPADTVELKALKTMFKSCMTNDGSNRKKSKTL